MLTHKLEKNKSLLVPSSVSRVVKLNVLKFKFVADVEFKVMKSNVCSTTIVIFAEV
jgi:hypothetical protein